MKACKLACGFALLAIGGALALPFVPGPGIPLILLGLLLLSDRFTWARKAQTWAREKIGWFRRGQVAKASGTEANGQ